MVSALVNDAVAATLAFLDVAILDPRFENSVGGARDLIAGTVAAFEFVE